MRDRTVNKGRPVPGRELTLLSEGRVELLGRILRSSNETFLVRVSSGADSDRRSTSPKPANARSPISSPGCSAGNARPTCSVSTWSGGWCRRR